MMPVSILNTPQITNKAVDFLGARFFARCFIAVGLILRAAHYLGNRSFWLDETVTAVLVVNRSWMEILRHIPLADNSAQQPYLFMLLEKIMVSWFGNHELVLRFWPFCAGLAGVFAFDALIRKICVPAARTLALALFVFSSSLIYYAGELKPYSIDVLATILLVLMAVPFPPQSLTWGRAARMGAAGAVSLWISNPSVFILAAIALCQGVPVVTARQYRLLKYWALTWLLWAASFGVLYWVSFSGMASDAVLFNMWKNSFMPQPLWSVASLRWLKEALTAFFMDPVGQGSAGVAALVFAAGAVALARKDMKFLGALLLSFFFTLLATALHVYPFGGRLSLFLVPLILIILAEGVVFLNSFLKPPFRVFAVVLPAMMLFPSLWQAGLSVWGGFNRQSNREAVAFLSGEARSGDTLVLNSEAQFPFWYYSQRFGCERFMAPAIPVLAGGERKQGYVVGQFLDHLLTDLPQPYALFRYMVYVFNTEGFFRELLSNDTIGQPRPVFMNTPLDLPNPQRAWFFFSSMNPVAQDFLLFSLDRQGKRLTAYEGKGAAVYLYDLTPRTP